MAAPNITTIDATTTVTTTVVVPQAPKPHEETREEKEQRILTHHLLARQLEYYFSTMNLSRDTYLSTLRELNDSYVPVSIIANFGKVQALAPYESALEAVVAAATDHSDLLEIVELNEEGKKVARNEDDKNDETAIILGVGSVTGEPIPMSQIPKTTKPKRTNTPLPSSDEVASPKTGASVASSSSYVQNTIILREVPKDVNEDTLRSMFDVEGFPSVESVRDDLHNCWFVTLATDSKDDMFNVMMKLRTMKFASGDPVKARLKSSASASPLTPNAVVYNPEISTMYAPHFNSGNGANSVSRKKRSNNKGRNNTNGANSNNKSKNNQQNGGITSKRRNGKDANGRSSNDTPKSRPKTVVQKPPSMGESNFPSLPPTSDGNSKPFQVEKVPMDDDMMRGSEKKHHSASGFSDSSSTATTSTVSTPTEIAPNGVVSGGYAAALLRPAAPVPVVTKKPVAEKPRQQQPSSKKAKDSPKKATKSKDAKTELIESNQQPAVVTIQPPAWGQGRSFADIVSA